MNNSISCVDVKNDYFKNLDDCNLTSHALLSVDNFVINEESKNLRDYLNQGGILNKNEISLLPYSESIGEIRVDDEKDLRFLINQSKEVGQYLQPLFDANGISYFSLFIKHESVNGEMESFLDKYGLLQLFKSTELTELCVSFPEKSN
ncbi:TPA: hypothetical protein PC505_003915 [Morganella morganii]|nr:hypothetical protein [Morganella morganii]HDF2424460.1 hypothetical protein [Morganella morganii]